MNTFFTPRCTSGLTQVPPANLRLPFFVGHGSADNLIPPIIATTTQAVLEGLGCNNVTFRMCVREGRGQRFALCLELLCAVHVLPSKLPPI
jgi:hypothetical protein